MFKTNTSWNSTIHQLNSDTLLRHILTKDKETHHTLNFSYCEASSAGNIIDSKDNKIGEFIVYF
jgi:hypothetical protein